MKLLPRSKTGSRSIDHFFQSLAEDQHERAIGVVLSGTGNLTVVPGDMPSLIVTADDNVLPLVARERAAYRREEARLARLEGANR